MRTPRIDFLGRAPRWAAISAALLIVSIGALLIRGLDLSIDFEGGTSFALEGVAEQSVTADELRDAALDAGAEEAVAQLQTDGEATTGALVRTEAFTPGEDQAVAIREALVEQAGAESVSVEFVGPFWGEQITTQALQALLVFLVVITVYISLRLEPRMAVAALIALAHDLLITVGLYALVGFTFSPATVIAILTILGYSLYDTVVVFDRVKEESAFLGEPGMRTYGQLVNASLNAVVWRTVNTTITSVLPVGALLFLGAQLLGAGTLQDLALALFIGMSVGIFSSLFVAGPLYGLWRMRDPEQQKLAKRLAEEGDDPEEAVGQASPEGRAPITTEYVRGQGRRRRRKR